MEIVSNINIKIINYKKKNKYNLNVCAVFFFLSSHINCITEIKWFHIFAKKSVGAIKFCISDI